MTNERGWGGMCSSNDTPPPSDGDSKRAEHTHKQRYKITST